LTFDNVDFLQRIERPPVAELLGWKLLHVERGFVRVSFTAREEFYNPEGVVQGGIIAAMLDDAMGPAGFTVLESGQFAPTLELKVNFMRPARAGTLIGEGRVEHQTKSVVFLSGRLTDEQGTLIATASATARVRTAN
jgi:uncharacterized protein (TIGR00369 family)